MRLLQRRTRFRGEPALWCLVAVLYVPRLQRDDVGLSRLCQSRMETIWKGSLPTRQLAVMLSGTDDSTASCKIYSEQVATQAAKTSGEYFGRTEIDTSKSSRESSCLGKLFEFATVVDEGGTRPGKGGERQVLDTDRRLQSTAVQTRQGYTHDDSVCGDCRTIEGASQSVVFGVITSTKPTQSTCVIPAVS